MRRNLGYSLLVLISTFVCPYAHVEFRATFFPGVSSIVWLFVWGQVTIMTHVSFMALSDMHQRFTDIVLSISPLSLVWLSIGVSLSIAIPFFQKRDSFRDWIWRYAILAVVLQVILPLILFFNQPLSIYPGRYQIIVFPIPLTGLIALRLISDIKTDLLKKSTVTNDNS